MAKRTRNTTPARAPRTSALEAVFTLAWKAYAPANAPDYVREYVFAPPRRWRTDFAFVAYKLAVEIDGGQYVRGGGRHNTDADREKMNAYAVLGWRVVRFSGSMLDTPEACIDTVCQALGIVTVGERAA